MSADNGAGGMPVAQVTMTFARTTVVVREASVAEIRAWWKERAAENADPARLYDATDRLLMPTHSLSELSLFTDQDPQTTQLLPSEMPALFAQIEELNRDFFAMCGRMDAITAKLKAAASETTIQTPTPDSSAS